MGDGSENYATLRAILERLEGRSRIEPLLRLGALHSHDFQRSTQSGRPDDDNLDAAIIAFTEAHGLCDPADPWRASIATGLARLQMARYATRSIGTDRDSAIELFEESLRAPFISALDLEIGRFGAAQMRLLRSFPEGFDAAGGPDPATMIRLLMYPDPARTADLRQTLAHLEAIEAAPPAESQVHAAAIAMLDLVRPLATLLGGGSGGGMADMIRASQGLHGLWDPNAPGAEPMSRMSEVLFQQRAANGLMDNYAGLLVEHMMNAATGGDLGGGPFLSASDTFVGSNDVVRDADRIRSEPFSDDQLRRLVDATVVAVAYPNGGDPAPLVAAEHSVARDRPRGEQATPDWLSAVLSAVAHLVAGDLRASVTDIGAALAGLPVGDPRAIPVTELLMLAVDDRYPLGGVLAVDETARSLLAPTAIAGLGTATPAARAVHAILRLIANARDTSALTDLEAATEELPPTYPWTCRARAVIGVVRGGRGGTDLLVANAGLVETGHSAYAALHAVAAYAALHAAIHFGASAAEAEARLAALPGDGPELDHARRLARAYASIATADRNGLAAMVAELEQARGSAADAPVAVGCGIQVALAAVHQARGDRRAFLGAGREALHQAWAAAEMDIQAGVEAVQLARTLAAEYATDDWSPGVLETVELAAATVARSLPAAAPYGLDRGGPNTTDIRRIRMRTGLSGEPAVPTARSVASALLAVDAAALVYLMPGFDELVVVTTDDRITTVAAPLFAAGPPADASPAALGDWAGRAVFAPLTEHLGGAGTIRHLVLVPVGELAAVPWHTARWDGGYVVTRFALGHVGCAGDLINAAHRDVHAPYDAPVLVTGVGAGSDETRALHEWVYPNAEMLDAGDMDTAALARLLAGPASLLHLPGAVPPPPPTADPDGSGVAVATGDGAAVAALGLLAAGLVGVVARAPGYDRPPLALVILVHHYLVDFAVGPAEALRRAQVFLLDPDRRWPGHLPPEPLAAIPDPADPANWAALRAYGP
jgi:hypothetical protein